MPSAPVRVILPGMLRDLVGGVSEIEVESPSESQTVAQLLDRAFAEHRVLDGKVRDERGRDPSSRQGLRQRRGRHARRGGRHAVPAGARVHIINAVSGG